MEAEQLKRELEGLSSQQLQSLGYVKLADFEKLSNFIKELGEFSNDLLDIINTWGHELLIEAETSKNASVILFAKTRLSVLSDRLKSNRLKRETK